MLSFNDTIMKTRFIRYSVLVAYMLTAVLLFFFTRLASGIIFELQNKTDDLFVRFFEEISFAIKFIGLYVLLLGVIAASGIFLSRKKKNKEFYKGFVYAGILCSLLILAYIIFVINIYIG